ncbi:MAG: hypothetical protein AVDCRST_MAG30-2865, partial [uncultured Solirubrobacteraceae bacterium]
DVGPHARPAPARPRLHRHPAHLGLADPAAAPAPRDPRAGAGRALGRRPAHRRPAPPRRPRGRARAGDGRCGLGDGAPRRQLPRWLAGARAREPRARALRRRAGPRRRLGARLQAGAEDDPDLRAQPAHPPARRPPRGPPRRPPAPARARAARDGRPPAGHPARHRGCADPRRRGLRDLRRLDRGRARGHLPLRPRADLRAGPDRLGVEGPHPAQSDPQRALPRGGARGRVGRSPWARPPAPARRPGPRRPRRPRGHAGAAGAGRGGQPAGV